MPISMADIVSALAVVEAGTPGIRKAFEYAPTALTPLPCFVNFVEGGEYVFPRFGGQREASQRIRSVALIALQADSADAERTARPLVENFVTQLDQHKTLDNTAGVIEAAVATWEYGPVTMQTQEQPYLGVSFDVRVNTIEQINYRSSG